MKGYHDIYIIKVGDTYRVRPAVWSTDAQETDGVDSAGSAVKIKPALSIRNLVDKPVLVVLPADILQSPSSDSQFILEAARTSANPKTDRRKVELKKKVADGVPGAYTYTVVVYDTDGMKIAVGESEPVIIIDPPPV